MLDKSKMDVVDFNGVKPGSKVSVIKRFFEAPHTVTGQESPKVKTGEFKALTEDDRDELADQIRSAYGLNADEGTDKVAA
jgi:hypothetical protein